MTRAFRHDGSHGWDAYADFYDWENARTLGRRDVAFWRDIANALPGPLLELGCGTGRLLLPLARSGVAAVGVDRSAPMLDIARPRRRRLPVNRRPALVRADMRALPFRRGGFGFVLAAYGVLQSLLVDADLDAVLSGAARVLRRGGVLGIDVVPDLPRWNTYRRQVSLRGRSRAGGQVTLIETVRQDRRRGLTIFDDEFVERRGRRTTRRRVSLTFRTLPLDALLDRLDRAGFRVESRFGDYRCGPWTEDADVWLILARKR